MPDNDLEFIKKGTDDPAWEEWYEKQPQEMKDRITKHKEWYNTQPAETQRLIDKLETLRPDDQKALLEGNWICPITHESLSEIGIKKLTVFPMSTDKTKTLSNMSALATYEALDDWVRRNPLNPTNPLSRQPLDNAGTEIPIEVVKAYVAHQRVIQGLPEPEPKPQPEPEPNFYTIDSSHNITPVEPSELTTGFKRNKDLPNKDPDLKEIFDAAKMVITAHQTENWQDKIKVIPGTYEGESCVLLRITAKDEKELQQILDTYKLNGFTLKEINQSKLEKSNEPAKQKESEPEPEPEPKKFKS